MYIPKRYNKESALANLYSLLGLPRECSFEEIEQSFQRLKKLTDPDVTGDNSLTQTYEEIKLAYETLRKKETRDEYDSYLDSLGVNMEHEEEQFEEDPEEKKKRTGWKKQFMEDIFNQEYLFMFNKRFKKDGGAGPGGAERGQGAGRA